jgi:sulfatase modifying factor 1
MSRICASLILFCANWLSLRLTASAVTIDYVLVGDSGNPSDSVVMTDGTSGYGSVPYSYNIDRFDVTTSQYAEFLNAKDPTGANALGLYNSNMSDATFGGISFSTSNASGSKYGVIAGRGNHPANFTSWYDAIRFANWLNNGQGNSDTEMGAYTLGPLGPFGVPVNGNAITRNAGAKVFLPSENEWYKAAYYNPATNSYFQYPTNSNVAPTAEAPPGGSNSANYNSVVGNLTDVGANTQTKSPYNAFDMGGNVFEWNEALINSSVRGLRGGSFDDGLAALASSFRTSFGDPEDEPGVIGFRVASISVATSVGAWTGAISTDFADSANWSGSVPGALASTINTDTALFSQNTANSPLTIDSGRNLQNIVFDTPNVDSLTIGMVFGPALVLTAGGTIQTTSTVVSPQKVDAPLVLEGDYTFKSGAGSSSATLTFSGAISPGATSGITTLTLDGGNTGENTIRGTLANNGSGQLAVTKSGTGLWIFEAANTYSGGTTISSGTLMTTSNSGLGVGPLTITAANNITTALNLGGDETVSDVTINQSGTGAAIVNVSAGHLLTSTGALTTTGTFNATGPGTIEIDGAPTLNHNSNLNLAAGALRFNVNEGPASIGTGVTVRIASGATLELAGSIAALSSGSDRVGVINDSKQGSGGMLLVSGTNQQVGAIDGTGDTVVNDGSDLTANHIIQSALVIGGSSKNPGLVTIDASDASGNPLADGLFQDGSLTSSDLFGAGFNSADLIAESTTTGFDSGAPAQGSLSAVTGLEAVPEPSSLLLFVLGALALGGMVIAGWLTNRVGSQS